jgi:hypothetical protein
VETNLGTARYGGDGDHARMRRRSRPDKNCAPDLLSVALLLGIAAKYSLLNPPTLSTDDLYNSTPVLPDLVHRHESGMSARQ